MICNKCGGDSSHLKRLDMIKDKLLDNDTVNLCSDFFKLIADPTRLNILLVLEQQELCVSDIACVLNMSLSAVSHQLRILKSGRLIKSQKVGKEVFYDLNDEHVRVLLDVALEHLGENHEG